MSICKGRTESGLKTMKTLIIKTQQDLDIYEQSGELCNLDLRQWKGGFLNMNCLAVNDCYMQNTTFDCFVSQAHCIFEGAVNQSNSIFKSPFSQHCTIFKGSVNQSNAIFKSPFSQCGATFMDSLNQHSSTFEQLVDQSGVIFKNVDQTNCTFKNILNQCQSTFNKLDQNHSIFQFHVRQMRATFKNLNQSKCTFHSLNQSECAFNGCVNQSLSTFKYIYQSGVTFMGEVKRNEITKDEIKFLKNLNLNILEMDEWQSNDNWMTCRSIEELHTCGTTYCLRGYAEAEYFIENGKEIDDPDLLIPNLKHLFHLTNEEAKTQIKLIIENGL